MKDIASKLIAKAAPKKKPGKAANPEIDLKPATECWSCHLKLEAEVLHCPSCKASTNLADFIFLAYINAKDAKSQFDVLEKQLIDQVRISYQDFAEDGKFSKTFDVSGTDYPGVQLSFKDAWIEIPIEKEKGLKQKLGPEYDQYFEQKRELSLRDTSDKTIGYLMETLGEEKFYELFQIKVSIGCKPDMDRKQFKLPLEVQMALVQHKPALKPRKED